MENIMNLLELGVFALGCVILALVIKNNKGRIIQYTASLIDQAELAVQGSGMGAEKKAMVLAQLDAAGIKVTAWLDKQIDVIVDTLNANGAWLAAQVKQNTTAVAEDGEDE